MEGLIMATSLRKAQPGLVPAKQPEHISDAIDRIMLSLGVDPRIIEAAKREHQGEKVNWLAVYVDCEGRDNKQLELGIVA